MANKLGFQFDKAGFKEGKGLTKAVGRDILQIFKSTENVRLFEYEAILQTSNHNTTVNETYIDNESVYGLSSNKRLW